MVKFSVYLNRRVFLMSVSVNINNRMANSVNPDKTVRDKPSYLSVLYSNVAVLV